MFHEMSEKNRSALAEMLVECQNHILRREGVKPMNRELYPGQITEKLPPGTAHAYGKLRMALDHLNAPEASDAHLIKLTTGDGYTLRHKAGCFHVQYFTDVVWHVHDYVTNKLWRVFPQTDRDGDGYFIAVRGQIDPVKCGNTWLSVLDTIADNYDV